MPAKEIPIEAEVFGGKDEFITDIVSLGQMANAFFLENPTMEPGSIKFKFDIEYEYDGLSYLRLYVIGHRLETPAEQDAREAKERAAADKAKATRERTQAARAAAQEAKDRAEYARLKEKFEKGLFRISEADGTLDKLLEAIRKDA